MSSTCDRSNRTDDRVEVHIYVAVIGLHLVEVGFCDARYADAVHFVSALGKRLQRYVDNPRSASAVCDDGLMRRVRRCD